MRPSDIDLFMPKMRCDHGCDQCCNYFVPCSSSDYDRVLEYARVNGIKPQDNGLTCPWYQGGACAVYPARPMACRLFGHVAEMVCPKGYNTNIPKETAVRIGKMCAADWKAGRRVLHEVLAPRRELEAMVKAILQGEKPATLTIGGNKYMRSSDQAYHSAKALNMVDASCFPRTIFNDVSEAPEALKGL